MITPSRFQEWLVPDETRRRVLGIQATLALFIVGVLFYWVLAMKYLPEFGIMLAGASVGVVIIALTGPRVTFPLYFATWFSSGIPLLGFPITINKLVAAAFFLSWIVSLSKRHFRVPNRPAVYLLAIYTLYALIASLLLKVEGAPFNVQQLMYLVVAYAVGSYFRRSREFIPLVAVLLAITCAIQSVGLFEYILRRDLFPSLSDLSLSGEELRINGIAKNAIQYAFACTWVLPWALLLLIESKSKTAKWLSLAALLYLVVLCLLTFNRQTPVIIAAMFLVGMTFVRYRFKVWILILLLGAGAVVAPLYIPRVMERFTQLGESEGVRPDPSLAIRRDKFIAARQMIQDHPWFGIGLNNFKDKWAGYRAPGEMYVIQYDKFAPHYIDLGYLQLITETGLVGVGLFCLTIGASFFLWLGGFRRALHLETTLHRNLLAAAAMGFTQLLLSLLLQDTFFIPRTYLLFGLLFAVITMVRVEGGGTRRSGGAEPEAAS